jgi:hypothetical protein
MNWTPLSQPPVIGYIYQETYGFEVVEVKLADGRICAAEYSFHSEYDPPNYWMVTTNPDEEDGTYYWDEAMGTQYPERVPVVEWRPK